MKQQTAVEWLFKKMTEQGTNPYWDMRFIQAKQMEKEQIMGAHIEGQRVFDKHPHTHWTNDQAEQYYNEMYK